MNASRLLALWAMLTVLVLLVGALPGNGQAKEASFIAVDAERQPDAARGATRDERASGASRDGDIISPPTGPNKSLPDDEAHGDPALERDRWFYSRRTAGTNSSFTLANAAVARAAAATAVQSQHARPVSPGAGSLVNQAWVAQGPNPLVQDARGGAPAAAVSGRVSALAVRASAPNTIYLGAAQGGLWTYNGTTGKWQSVSNQFSTLAVGAIALAPSQENTIYVGTGEGNLSGDSYYGDGVMKSTDAGVTWSHVGGNFFGHVSISKIVVDPTNASHLYVATLRGRAGAKRTSPPNPSGFGIFESLDGGGTWIAKRTVSEQNGATDLVIDPLVPTMLFASFWGDKIYKTVDGGATWAPAMAGLPASADYGQSPTRFALTIARPTGAVQATLYTGFDYFEGSQFHSAVVYRSLDSGTTWLNTNSAPPTATNPDAVGDYCGQQCFYDNVVQADPLNPNIVYALGQFNYATGTGGIYRSTNGGASWMDLGYGQHPDFHAIAIRNPDRTAVTPDPLSTENIVIGNDGGVWSSRHRGGRTNASDPLSATDWQNLNGTLTFDAANQLTDATGSDLQITQFSSVGQHPTNNRLFGGAQDNGTSRRFNVATSGSAPWVDFAGGDGGQVLVDPYDPSFVYGTYYSVSPYRWTNGASAFNSNEMITNGIETNDRSDFYVPFAMDPETTSRLYLGTFRMYRTDNRGTQWRAISSDLTSGCPGSAPNGARACAISAIGVTAGGPQVYAGTLDGLLWRTVDATAATPSWQRVDMGKGLPQRPVNALAVDRSNYRVAYATYSSFDAATPATPGHVFMTSNGGDSWINISGNLPDVPVNSLVIDPTNAKILYVGTDVGPMVTVNSGATWTPLGTGFPTVTIWQLDYSAFKRRLVAGTHGRGAWAASDEQTALPAVQVRATTPGTPVGPGTDLTYLITVKNLGNTAATGVTVKDPIPGNTTFKIADNGGSNQSGTVVWSGLTVPAASANATTGALVPGSIVLKLTVSIAGTGVATGTVITNDGLNVTAAEFSDIVRASPVSTTLAKSFQAAVSPKAQVDGTRAGQTVLYTLMVKNQGYSTDAFSLASGGNSWPTKFFLPNFTQEINKTGNIDPGMTVQVGVKVMIPADAVNNSRDIATITVGSINAPAANDTATLQTIAVTVNILLVDGDQDIPDVNGIYTAALDKVGLPYNIWNLKSNPVLPATYLKAHRDAIWYTGNAYPAPLGAYEEELATFLNGGGRLFVSGWDVLDGNGYSPFVRDYLHVQFDAKKQNDIGTISVTAVDTNPVTKGMGTLVLDTKVLDPKSDFSDEITPLAPALAAFLDHAAIPQPDAVSVDNGTYKVVFLAFPFEGLGTADQRADLMTRTLAFFDSPSQQVPRRTYLPLVQQ
ncbi:MAG: hypothetical protein NVSMB42_05410 [Herpetosiphon sp.]